TELRHVDWVVTLRERHELPVAAPRVNLHQEFTRLYHDGIKIVRGFAVAAKFQVDLDPGIRRRQYFRNKLKALRIEVVAGDARNDHHLRLRLEISNARRTD